MNRTGIGNGIISILEESNLYCSIRRLHNVEKSMSC
jgi:hypothetical protein